MKAVLLLGALVCAMWVPSAWSQAIAPQTVVEVWVHDVPGPSQGDFWDSSTASAIGLLAGRAGVYPDVMVCARPLTGGARSCSAICWDLQGDSKRGGKQTSTECRQPLRVSLGSDPRLQIEVLEMDSIGGQPQVRTTMARVGITDPSSCPHERPCEMQTPTGPLVVSFLTRSRAAPPPAATPAPSPPPEQAGCKRPSLTWDGDLDPEPSGLHGPYASVDEALNRDGAGYIALLLTGAKVKLYEQGTHEHGFLILRDRRQRTGGYYTTPPVRSTDTGHRPRFLWKDYMTSGAKAFSGSCEKEENFTLAATVHTHPLPLYWGWEPYFVDNFSMDDFNQAIQLKEAASPELQRLAPRFEKIALINARDRIVRTFAPAAGDRQFAPGEMSTLGWFVTRNQLWQSYASRVLTLRSYPAPK